MSDEFPTLPDVLNDNAGVVGAAAGLAVSRNVQATNRSIRNLQNQLGAVQKELAKSRARDEWEEWHREKLYRISVEVGEVGSQQLTRASLVNVAALAYRFQTTIPGTSAFRSLQDKEFLQSTESAIANLWTACCTSLPSAFKDLQDLCAWQTFHRIVRRLLDLERTKAQTSFEVEVKKRGLQVAIPAMKSVWLDAFLGRHKGSSVMVYGALVSLILGISLLASAYGKPDTSLSAGGGLALVFVVAPLLIALVSARRGDFESRACDLRESARKLEAKIALLSQEEDALRVEALPLSTHVPSDLLDYFCNRSDGLDERKQKHLEIAAYADALAEGFGVDGESLPTGLLEWVQSQTSGALQRATGGNDVTDEQILESLAKAWEVSPLQISPGSLLERDLGWYREIVMAGLEHDFNVEIHPEVIAGVETVRDAIEATQAALGKKRSQSKA